MGVDATAKRTYTLSVIYEWDERKRTANLEKHGLDLAEAWKVFEAPLKITFRAPHTESGEDRRLDIAEVTGSVLVRVFDAALKNR